MNIFLIAANKEVTSPSAQNINHNKKNALCGDRTHALSNTALSVRLNRSAKSANINLYLLFYNTELLM